MARMEIWTGQQRRRNWSDEQKLKILQEVATSELGISEIARRHDIIPQQIYTWRRQLSGNTNVPGHSPPLFLPVTVTAPEPEEQEPAREERARSAEQPKSTSGPTRIEIRCKGGRVLKVGIGVDPTVLRGLIRSVEEA